MHLQEIARSSCKDWKWLGPYLKIGKVEVNDIDNKRAEEKVKRLEFFQVWVEKDGSDASYYKLIDALLKNGKKEDAEFVCTLLQVESAELLRRQYFKDAARTSESKLTDISAPVGTFSKS